MNPLDLPVHQQRDRILEALASHQAIVVESPTGSGKTTQIPQILYQAGYAEKGVIGVTQPRRIAAISVSQFIARQLRKTIPDVIGYKMRFEDQTDQRTHIKIMTDGILLQEMKADYHLSRYSLIMVDEAHERSLNIDFILGLLKRVLRERPTFKVIVSSATINAELFCRVFRRVPRRQDRRHRLPRRGHPRSARDRGRLRPACCRRSRTSSTRRRKRGRPATSSSSCRGKRPSRTARPASRRCPARGTSRSCRCTRGWPPRSRSGSLPISPASAR